MKKVDIWYPDSKEKRPRLIRGWMILWATNNVSVDGYFAGEFAGRRAGQLSHAETWNRYSNGLSELRHLPTISCWIASRVAVQAAVAEKLQRRWIACDLGRFAIHTTRKRLLSIPGVKPFVVQNLGKYERQAWQTPNFRQAVKSVLEEQRQREGAYRKFILDLYHATPMSGHTWLHGVKSGRWCMWARWMRR